MSFLNRVIIKRGYLGTPHKRLNSISDISIEPIAKKSRIVYRTDVNPFEQHYVTPLLRMIEAEEREAEERQEEEAKNKLITDEQKSTLKRIAEAAASSNIGKRYMYAVRRTQEQPLDSLYDLVTLPADIINAVDTKFKSDNETGRLLKQLQQRDDSVRASIDELLDDQNTDDSQDDTEVRTILNSMREYISSVGKIPAWTIRQLRRLKNKYSRNDSSDMLQDENRHEDDATKDIQNMQALYRSKYQEDGYKKRMDATKSLQALLKSQEVQKEYERQQKAAETSQGFLISKKQRKQDEEEKQDEAVKYVQAALDKIHSNRLQKPTKIAQTLLVSKKQRDLYRIERDIAEFLKRHPDPRDLPLPDYIQEAVELFLKNKKTPDPTFPFNHPIEALSGYYEYDPKNKRIFPIYTARHYKSYIPPGEGFVWL